MNHLELSDHWQNLRDQWALKCPVSESSIDVERRLDRSRNPYNDPYKPEIRSDAAIVSDVAYRFADVLLMRAYPGLTDPYSYATWLHSRYNSAYELAKAYM